VLARIIEEVSSYARTVPAAARAHRQLVQDTTAAITAARASLVVPVLPSILSAGEPSGQVARSDEERALDAAEGMVDKLRDALVVLAPIILLDALMEAFFDVPPRITSRGPGPGSRPVKPAVATSPPPSSTSGPPPRGACT
jgi:hypothetical protein